MANIEFNIENYTEADLLKLFSLEQDNLTQQQIFDVTNHYISKMQTENNEHMAIFFKAAQDRLIQYLEADNDTISTSDDSSSDEEENDPLDYTDQLISNMEYDDNDTELQKAITPSHAAPKNKNEANKITDRVNNTELVGVNTHYVQKRKNLGISDVMQVPVTQGILNPNLTNKLTKLINVDSQYRQNISMTTAGNPCDFTIDLSEPVNDVIQMRLFSLQVPFTWWLIDEAYGTNFFLLDGVKITIDEGNYTLPQLIDEINLKLPGEDVSANLHMRNGKTTFNFNIRHKITFFDKNYQSNSKIDNNLGYIIGFRESEYVSDNSITSEAVGDTYGTKYFLLHIDDFNQNQMNTNIIGASDNPITHLKEPIYFARDSEFVSTGSGTRDIFVVPREKKDLTIAQMHALNEINANRTREDLRNIPPTMKNMFGLVPIKRGDFLGPAFTENGGSLQSNERVYFGPVNINRLHIKLLDDKGNTVNLNGCNWSFSMVAETLYQY